MNRKLIGLVALMFATSGTSRADYLPIYGGPTYDSSTGDGYVEPFVFLVPQTSNAGSGFGAWVAKKYVAGNDKGYRAVRWSPLGAIELDNLGTDAFGVTISVPYAVNDAGTVVGKAQKYDAGIYKGTRPLRWDASGMATELDNLGTNNLGFTDADAVAINDAGTAAGDARKYEGETDKGFRAVRWDASGTAMELGHLGTNGSGVTNSFAHAINYDNVVAGNATRFEAGIDKGRSAVRWDDSGTPAELDALGADGNGRSVSEAYAINNSGTIVGYGEKFENGIGKGRRAVRWDGGGVEATELDNLGTLNGSALSEAYAVNDAGTAVGYSYKYDAVTGSFQGSRGVRWDAFGSAATELGILGTYVNSSSVANSINDGGITVGQSEEHSDSGTFLGQRAVMWGLDGTAIKLNDLIDPNVGWTNLYLATGISNDFWITGIGKFDPDGSAGLEAYDRLFLMHVPEPASIVLLALGGLAMLCRRALKHGRGRKS